MIQLSHLHYFKLLAENEHLLNTARQIHISPPALSATISRLEAELGVDLFDRVGRNIRLNENGKRLYIHVCNIFCELDSIKQDLSQSPPEQEDIIKIAVSAPTLWNEVIGVFMKEHPGVTVKHSTLLKDQMDNPDVLSQYDLIITDIGEIASKFWEHKFLVEDPPTLLVHSDHPFARRKSIALLEAQYEPFIALSQGYASRESFENACKQAGFMPRIVAEGDYQLRAQLVKSGYGIAFSSVMGARAYSSPLIKMVPVKYPPNPRMQSIFWKTGNTLSESAIRFRDFLIQFYRTDNVLPPI